MKPRIYIVDDEAPARARLRMLLADIAAECPHEVVGETGEAGAAAESIAAACADIVLLDVQMPGMNGIDLAHEIRRQYHDLPVLLASGYSHVLAQNGTYGFELLHKPYSVEQLSRLLRKVATWQRRKRIMGK